MNEQSARSEYHTQLANVSLDGVLDITTLVFFSICHARIFYDANRTNFPDVHCVALSEESNDTRYSTTAAVFCIYIVYINIIACTLQLN